MKIDSIVGQESEALAQRLSPGAEPAKRPDAREPEVSVPDGAEPDESRVSPTEILERIRAISQDGLYSVRFEKSEEINELVVKVVDPKTEEVIRQIPPETILGIRASLMEFTGKIVNKYS